jgi:hypothetical protein
MQLIKIGQYFLVAVVLPSPEKNLFKKKTLKRVRKMHTIDNCGLSM